MKIECCACSAKYPLDGNTFHQSGRHESLLVCPHCGLEHVLSFLPVPQRIRPPAVKPLPLRSIKLAQTYYPLFHGSRILDSSRVDQSGADDADVTDWDPSDDFIVAFTLYTSKGTLSRYIKLLWRNVTQDGSFADVAATGEINHTADTVLVDQDDLLVGNKRCDPVTSYDWNHNRSENEGDNLVCDTFPYPFLDEYYTEFQWALSPSGASYSDEYELQVYDVTEDTVIATLPSSITMMSDPAGGKPVHMMHYARLRRS